MQAALEFAPLVVFLAAYYLRDLYFATGALMVAMAVMLVADYALQRRVPRMHLLSAVLVWGFGTATLVLRDAQFIKWKPTIFLWIVALAFAISGVIRSKPLAQRFLQPAVAEGVELTLQTWRRLNWLWVAFYGALGAANLWVAQHFSERVWVNFKVIGLTVVTLVFVTAQAIWLGTRASTTRTPT
ncbi:MAG: inner membrane-spanning protein YciB [Steroidobacteraceae bacterium]